MGRSVRSDIHFLNDISFSLPIWAYVFIMTLFTVGSANAINFTDGLDGLLSFVAIPAYFFFFIITEHQAVQVFSLIMIGALIAFLLYNKYPAKIFMGDTGSMAIGGSLSFLAVIEHVEILIPFLFIIYLAEQFSVIIQVFVFKRTKGYRVFRMTPIHFHYSLKYGWSENKIVLSFGMVGWIFTLLSLGYWKLFLN